MEPPEELRQLEARVSATRYAYQTLGTLAIKEHLETAERQLEEYQYGHTTRQVLPT